MKKISKCKISPPKFGGRDEKLSLDFYYRTQLMVLMLASSW